MIKRYLILAIAVFIAVSSTFGQQDYPVLRYTRGQLQLERGSGELFNFGGGPDAQKQGYSKIYYLFTDSSFVFLSSQYNGSRDDYWRNIWSDNYKFAIKYTDSTSRLVRDGSWEKNRVVSGNNIRRGGYGFFWKNRAMVMFDAIDEKTTSTNYTVALVVLPVPSRDTLLTKPELTNKHIRDGNLTANLRIGRTGRIVFDSIWIDSIPQENVTYNSGGYQRDTPYYRNNPHADIAINIPVSQEQNKISVKVFYRLLNPDGTIIPTSETLSVPIRIDFPFIPVGIAVVLSIVLFVLLRWFIRKWGKEKPMRDARRAERDCLKKQMKKMRDLMMSLEQQVDKLKKESAEKDTKIHYLENQLNESQGEMNNLKSQLEMAKDKEYTSEDSKEFRQRCNEVRIEINHLYDELNKNGGCMPPNIVAEKLRQLGKRIYIMQNK